MSEGRKRIFIVEDQRLIAADLENTLRKLGYDVVGNAPSGEMAIERTVTARPEVVLMDIRLQGELDGIAAATAIRQRLDVPVVYLTAYADEETIARAKLTGPFGYVVKPFNERELRAAIEIAVYKHETDRLLAEERARRKAAEEFRLLVESVQDYAIFRLDGEGRIASWNLGAERMKGYCAEEVIGRHFSMFYTPEDLQQGKHRQMLERARTTGAAHDAGWRVRKDGTRFWAGAAITALHDDEGRLHGFAKITHDMTERRRHEEALEQAIRARDEFLQIASHELKTPLTPLQLQLDALARALERAGVQNERLTRKLEAATRQAARLSRLVESLLDVSRITGGRLALELEEFDLAELVCEVADRFRDEARQAGCDLVVRADGALVGRWDRLRLEQLVANILSNALKYGAGRPVTVELRQSDGMVRMIVTDRGIGIAAEALERIFGRFERAVPVRHYGGLGLGLYIARQIAEAHGGTIMARSEPGAGATFTVLLPRDAAAGPRPPAQPASGA
jgi:PAS domain S-box-containing protein